MTPSRQSRGRRDGETASGVWLLALTSLLWAFSFGLIKTQLAGLSAAFVAAARLLLATLAFLPCLRWKGISARLGLMLIAIGAVQYGAMYVLYIRSYAHLAAHEVALFTVLTPLHIALLGSLLERRWAGRALVAAALACAGAAVIQARATGQEVWLGFGLVQLANLCFAAGQIAYRRLPGVASAPHLRHYALLYAGGAFVAGCVAALELGAGGLEANLRSLSGPACATLLYLGLVPSALGFFLWNVGATRVSLGTLAAFQNWKIPLAIVVSLLFFGERPNITRLVAGASIILVASLLATRPVHRPPGAGA